MYIHNKLYSNKFLYFALNIDKCKKWYNNNVRE